MPLKERIPLLDGKTPRTIRYRIVSLVLLVLTPLLVIFGWMAFNLAEARMALIELHRADVAEKISARADRELSSALGMLTGMAASNDLASGDIADFSRQAGLLVARAEFARIWAFDASGATLAEAGRPGSEEAASPVPAAVLARTRAGQASVSSVMGQGLDKTTVLVTVPLPVSTPAAGIGGEVHVRSLDRVFTEVGLEQQWVAAIVDRNGQFLARSLDAEHRVGQPARPELKVAANAADAVGTFENETWEGVRMLNSYRRSPLTGWTTVVAVPTALVNAPLVRNALLVLLLGIGALTLSIVAAYAYARRISEPVRALSGTASALVKGQAFADTRYRIVELDEVRAAFEGAIGESAHLAALVASSGDAIMSMRLDGTILTWNPAAERLFGYPAAEVVGKSKTLIVPADKLEEFRRQQAEVASGASVRSETVRCSRDGIRIAVSVDAAPIRRPDGTVIGSSSILHDITDRIAADEHRQFLMRELAHRSKNQLAIIQAIATQTARSSVSLEQFLERFRGRLQGLSASHDLLLAQNWRGAPLDDLVRSQIAVFVGPASNAVTISGPSAMLGASAAEAIALAIHELATNSAKYGALSTPAGRVQVTWDELGRPDGESDWELCWRESGGPTVTAPTTSGFGTQVIKRMTAMAVHGTADLEYRPGGLQWRLRFPKSAMRLDGKLQPDGRRQPVAGRDADVNVDVNRNA